MNRGESAGLARCLIGCAAALTLLGACEPYDPEGRLVSPDAVAATAPPPSQPPGVAVVVTPATAQPERPRGAAPAPVTAAATAESPHAPPKPREKLKDEPQDDTPELFDCIKPSQCPLDLAARAKKRAARAWDCDAATITSEERPTKGLSVSGSTMVITGEGTAELHVKPGITGGKAFALSGCGRSGLIACVPAHRLVKTADVTYDKIDDRVCLWATAP